MPVRGSLLNERYSFTTGSRPFIFILPHASTDNATPGEPWNNFKSVFEILVRDTAVNQERAVQERKKERAQTLVIETPNPPNSPPRIQPH